MKFKVYYSQELDIKNHLNSNWQFNYPTYGRKNIQKRLFMFYYYYPHLKTELGNKKYEILKEALAIFTDPRGTDKPEVKKLEQYFKQYLNEPINKIMEKEEWKNYFKLKNELTKFQIFS